MTLTLMSVYNECAGQPWSMYDNDANTLDDLESALKISINKAASVLWNLQPWQFRVNDYSFITNDLTNDYDTPNGTIYSKIVKREKRFAVKCNGKILTLCKDYEVLDDAKGTPTSFYIDGDKIHFYPTPDKEYNIDIKYLLLPYAKNVNGEEKAELVNDKDYINIPDKYEVLFKNCLISLAMIYAIADESDENHSGYKKQYEDSLNILINYCNTGLNDKNIVF